MKLLKKLRNVIEKACQLVRKLWRGLLQRKRYVAYVENFAVQKNVVLLESQHGRAFDGNIFAVAKELAKKEEYKHLTLYVSTEPKNKKKFQRLLESEGMERIRLLSRGTYHYFKILATAGWLVNDNTWIYCFIKRPEQIYVNTWHGTPLKTLGKANKSEYFSIGNAQKTFLDADYLLYPNEFTMQHMIQDYMVDNIGQFTPLLGGYPRNSVFFDEQAGKALREKYHLEGKTVYAYLPTWRGTIGNVSDEEQDARLLAYFKELDGQLSETQILYVKMHTISASHISLDGFQHILPFPKEETYAFLNAVDGLVTDYSSIFFDFAVTRKKIILFPYDLEEYEADRGFYFPLSELPFPQVRTTRELCLEMASEKEYDDTAFLQKFCAYDSADAPEQLCRRVFLGEKCLREEAVPNNGKENVLLQCGDFALNGVTVSINNLLANVDVTEKNYIILIKTGNISKYPERLLELPEGVRWLGYSNCLSTCLTDTIRFKLWTSKYSIGTYQTLRPMLDKIAEHDYRRIAGRASITTAVHFNGYSNHITMVMGAFPCRKIIYAHNDMDAELRSRTRMKREILCNAYRTFDAVAVVTEDLLPMVEKVSNYIREDYEKKHKNPEDCPVYGQEPNAVVVPNVINYRKILQQAEEQLEFDEEQTILSIPEPRLRKILDSDSMKLINIGRFSPEKGHIRLMQQFARILPEHPDTYLIIMGSRGDLYEETLKEAERLNCGEHVIIIYYMSNPFALLKKCDYFVFSSFYEGFGLVLAEADILGVKCVSTDITGPKKFMERYGGTLVENSDEGVYQALSLCVNNQIDHLLNIDYEAYNKQAVQAFLKTVSSR